MKSKRIVGVLPMVAIISAIFSSQNWAESGVDAGRRNPAAADAPVRRLAYRSSFDAYRMHREQAPADWRGSNNTVGAIGGWRAYAQESQPVVPGASTNAADPHAGHGAAPKSDASLTKPDPHAGHAQAQPPQAPQPAPGTHKPMSQEIGRAHV